MNNKNYRVVWSDARQAFIAVSENARSKGKPKSAVRSALALAAGALFLAPAAALAACPSTITSISTALTDTQCYDNSENVTVTSTGSVGLSTTIPFQSAVELNNSYAGAFMNNGVISANTSIMGAGLHSGYGVTINGALNGSFVNTGTISAKLTVTGDINGWGEVSAISAADIAAAGSLSNTGTISAQGTGIGDTWVNTLNVRGIATGDIYGTVSNSGTISASGNGTATDFVSMNVYGATVDTIQAGGSFTNSGVINSSANATTTGAGYGAQPNAYGVSMGSINNGGRFTNTGSISAVALASGTYGYASGYGVNVGNLDGVFSNAGSISAMATSTGISSTYTIAYGIQVNGDMGATGTFNNAGSISASATATGPGFSDTAEAYGVRVGGNVDGSFTNTGTISATAASPYVANAWGVSIDSSLTGTLANTGVITATATSPDTATAYGLRISGAVDNTLTNSGVISATASSSGNFAAAYGVSIQGPLNGTLTNTGTISASATAPSGGATALRIQDLSGTVNNSGTISGTGSSNLPVGTVWGMFVAGGTGTINNLAGGVIEGGIHIDGGSNIAVNNAGVIDTRMNMTEVTGAYNQAATGVFRISASDNATHGRLGVGNVVTLAPGTTISITGTPGHALTPGTVSAVIASSCCVTMSTVNVTDNVLALNYQAVQSGSNLVDLVATSTGLTTVQAAVPGNMGSVGGTMDSLMANIGSLPQDMQNYLYNLGSQTSPQAITEEVRKIQPMVLASLSQTGLDAARGGSNVVLARMENNLGRSAGDKFYGDQKFWLKPFGSWADQNDRGGAIGYKARSFGMIGGVDADVNDYRLGLAFGYSRSDVDGNSSSAPQSADVNSYQFLAYGSKQIDKDSDISFRAGIGFHDNKTRREINTPGSSVVATAGFGGTSFNLGGAYSRPMAWSGGRTTFTPSIRADYTTIRNNSYIESGAGALGLSVGKNGTAMFVIGADGKFIHEVSDRAKIAANIGVGFDLINETSSITSAFAGTPTAAFSTQGMKLDPWIVRGGIGYIYKMASGTEVTTRYDLDVRSGFTNQTVSVQGRWSF